MSEQALREQLEKAKESIEALEAYIEKITSPPYAHAVVVGFNSPVVGEKTVETVTVMMDGKKCEILKPDVELKKNDLILVNPQTSQWMATLEVEETEHVVRSEINVTWAQIGGQDEAKAHIQEAIELPFVHKKLFAAYRKRPTKGILMYGPPGCGKTMLAKAAYTSIAKSFGKQASEKGFIYVKGPELLDKYVGESESKIRSLFERARKFHEENNMPAIIFIDEADAVMAERGRRFSGINDTIVPMFLTEMDGLDTQSAVVILATNRPDMIDPAIVRDGRIDRKVFVGRPEGAQAIEILKLYFESTLLEEPADVLAKCAMEAIESPKHVFYEAETKDHGKITIGLKNLLSGAMLAGLVDQAASIALHRDIKSGGAASGISCEDVRLAVSAMFDQNRDTSHNQLVEEVVADKNVVEFRRVNYVTAA